MATNILLTIRLPALERFFGPLDRVYATHRRIGIGIVAAVGLHLVLIPVASVVDREETLLDTLSIAVPLGVFGALILVASVALALAVSVPYDRWQRVHMAVGLAFVVLTAHMYSGAASWFELTSPAGALLTVFAVLGIVSLVVRIVERLRGGVSYVVTQTQRRERGLEIFLTPRGAQSIAGRRPGQFVFVTAVAGGKRETHPFTLTSAAAHEPISVLIRPSGDWTMDAQSGIMVGDHIQVEGPFGAFTPSVDGEAQPHQVWVAAGAGITPFLSVLRTAARSSAPDRPAAAVRLIVVARDAVDVPCWEELSSYAQQFGWLDLHPVFTARVGRLSDDDIDKLIADAPSGANWYLCGPAGLTNKIEAAFARRPEAYAGVRTELYQWRGSASRPEVSHR